MDNQFTWERFLNDMPAGTEYSVAPNWSSDSWRKKIRKKMREGYFKRMPRNYEGKKRYYADWFIRTDKKYEIIKKSPTHAN